jgi:hypothetical protein
MDHIFGKDSGRNSGNSTPAAFYRSISARFHPTLARSQNGNRQHDYLIKTSSRREKACSLSLQSHAQKTCDYYYHDHHTDDVKDVHLCPTPVERCQIVGRACRDLFSESVAHGIFGLTDFALNLPDHLSAAPSTSVCVLPVTLPVACFTVPLTCLPAP